MTNTLSRRPAPIRDVLYEFSLAKAVPDAELLDEFVQRYPEHAAVLTDFAIELVVDSLRREEAVDTAIDTATVSAPVSRAMSTFQNALYANRAARSAAVAQKETQAVPVDNPFAMLERKAFRQLAQNLNANTVFVCKLRDRQIDLKTMSEGFLKFLAGKLRVVPETLAAFYAGGRAPVAQPQFYKAEQKPKEGPQQAFAEAVRTSGLTEEQQRYLLSL
jgi:hypothetical protein